MNIVQERNLNNYLIAWTAVLVQKKRRPKSLNAGVSASALDFFLIKTGNLIMKQMH